MFQLLPSVGQAILIAIPTALSSPGVTLVNLRDLKIVHNNAGKLVLGMLAVQDLLMCLLLSVPHALAFGIDVSSLFQVCRDFGASRATTFTLFIRRHVVVCNVDMPLHCWPLRPCLGLVPFAIATNTRDIL